jgi:hypothetical protein
LHRTGFVSYYSFRKLQASKLYSELAIQYCEFIINLSRSGIRTNLSTDSVTGGAWEKREIHVTLSSVRRESRLGDLGIEGRKILKLVLKVLKTWFELIWIPNEMCLK